ncbi:hypothetical protein PP485_gp30 [Gordonia phage ThankyouJordi]|uniref:Uncharacterized protein n=1 Tax=Gordonia phage ThankyouJordi TaxID=2571252 RepID=A0A4Y6EKB9_9CAUD|nr:hypothetical protein PP485_gp30 [Gordonia phage ThankyouJordi]QCW22215.1 hypothetical protein SEA_WELCOMEAYANNA_30 [Gordonia phage WelcomeAyanna]QDF17791.1 hypothetical protein SEA_THANKYOUJORDI_30 [Gordonia phage ThankyouJordi]
MNDELHAAADRHAAAIERINELRKARGVPNGAPLIAREGDSEVEDALLEYQESARQITAVPPPAARDTD